MIVNSKDNFTDIAVQLLNGLGFADIQKMGEDSIIDITATKDGSKYAFKCKYDIDAISEKDMRSFLDSTGFGGRYDKLVYITNSSFAVSAKRLAESEGIELWDRNTFDRMTITIADKIEDAPVKARSHTGLIILFIIFLVIVICAGLYYYFFLKK